jgi:hypothetical protein
MTATPLAMAQPVVTGAPFPIQVLVKPDKELENITWYLNATDSQYHIKGSVKNILPETPDGIIISINFNYRTTGAYLHRGRGSDGELLPTGGIAPGAILRFDMDTGYNVSQMNQFQYIAGIME